jgi:hypothetical protein
MTPGHSGRCFFAEAARGGTHAHMTFITSARGRFPRNSGVAQQGTKMRRILLALVLLSIALPITAYPVATDSPETPVVELERIVVSGTLPGPGMWKVSKGDHVLWILGTVSPLPRKMEWISRDVEAVIAQAQEAIASPTLMINAKVGFFQGLVLAPKLLGIRRNPDGALLQQVVPAGMYARWLPLKRKYVGNDRGIEKWRPMFAAIELYDDAIRKSGLTQGGVVSSVVSAAIKRNKVKLTSPTVKLTIDDPKAALSDFRSTPLADIDCFGKTLQRLETDLGTMVARANAWAEGDVETLRRLPYGDQNAACIKAATHASFAVKRGLGDADARMEQAWLDAVDKALANNRVTFASLDMPQLLAVDGYLVKLRAKGYTIEAP